MSSDTAPLISRSNDRFAVLTIACAGFCFAALQSVYFRELLSVFRGNELSIGIIFSVWLLATGASSALAARPRPDKSFFRTPVLVSLMSLFAMSGFFLIRASRLALGSGIAPGPTAILCVVVAAVAPFTFINGLLLGSLFSQRGRALYGAENAGAVAGALCSFVCIVLYAANSVIAALSLAPFLFLAGKHWRAGVCVFCCMAAIVVFDHASLSWKYAGMPVSRVVYGREGEIAFIAAGADTTVLVDGAIYRSTMEKPFCEQAVHVPMAQRPRARRALVVFDRGQGTELFKYPGLTVDILETEPALAARAGAAARVAAVETFCPAYRYDAVFLGTGIPVTAAENRFYTRSFFLKAKSLMSDSGIFSFSLPFSENYLGPGEQRLYNSFLSTLHGVWKNVAVFPGEGSTFMASDGACDAAAPLTIPVKTDYLVSTIIPGSSPERTQSANKKPPRQIVNTRDRPVTLFLGLQTWLERFKYGVWIIVALLGAAAAAVIFLLPKTREAFSLATSGFSTGIYSVCLLLLYQATFGALYSRVSLLLVGLTAGFAIGSIAKKFPLSDFFIGLYAVASLLLLAALPFPPAFLFYLFHAGIGVLAGAQFVTRSATAPASLYAADMLGGAIGMAACSTVLAPLFGIMPVAAGLFAIKVLAELVNAPCPQNR